jgi:hypothetical protein
MQFGFSLRNLCVLCVSAVRSGALNGIGDAEDAEVAQRVETPSASSITLIRINNKRRAK